MALRTRTFYRRSSLIRLGTCRASCRCQWPSSPCATSSSTCELFPMHLPSISTRYLVSPPISTHFTTRSAYLCVLSHAQIVDSQAIAVQVPSLLFYSCLLLFASDCFCTYRPLLLIAPKTAHRGAVWRLRRGYDGGRAGAVHRVGLWRGAVHR